MKEFKDTEFVIVDVETTGLAPQMGDRIIEVAALHVKNLKPLRRYHSMVNPQRELSMGAYLVNHISQTMLEGAPLAKDILPQVREFIGQRCVVGHNIHFDLKFLNNELSLAGLPLICDQPALDTVKMSRGLLPGLGRYSLENIVYHFGIEEKQEHRATGDVNLTYDIFLRLMEIAARKNIYRFETLIELFGIQKETSEDLKEKIKIIEEVIAHKGQLEFLYFSFQSGITLRMVTPKELVRQKKNMHLIGYCHLREEDRTFRVDRIIQIKPYCSQK